MAERKRVIRRVDHDSVADFDEQLWPINCLLLVMAAMVAGLVLAAKPSFDPPRFDSTFFSNGFVLLIGLAVIVIGLLVGTALLQHHAHARRMQLAVLLALLLHFWLAIGMYVIPIHFAATVHEDGRSYASDEESEVVVTIPDYGRSAPEAQVDPLAQPIATELPEHQQQASRESQPLEVPVQRPNDEAATVTPMVQPQPLQEMQRAVASAPHRASTPAASQLSRSEMSDHAAPATQPAQQIQVPQPSQAENRPALEATASSQRQRAAAATAQRPAASAPDAAPRLEAQAMARRSTDMPVVPAAQSGLARQQPNVVPQASPAAESVQPPAASVPQVAEAQPDRPLEASASAQRLNPATLSEAQRGEIQLDAARPTATASTAAMQRAELAQATPQLSAAQRSSANRSSTPVVAEVEATEAPQSQAPAATASNQPALEAAELAAQRSSAPAAVPAERPGAVSDLAQQTPMPASAGQAQLSRADASAAMQPSAAGPTAATLARARAADPSEAGGGLAGPAIAAEVPAARSGTEASSESALQPGGSAPSRLSGPQTAEASRPAESDLQQGASSSRAPAVASMSPAARQHGGEPAVTTGSLAQLERSQFGAAAGGGPTPQAPQVAAAAAAQAAGSSQGNADAASQPADAPGRIIGGSASAVAAARESTSSGSVGPNLQVRGTPAAARGTAAQGPQLASAQHVGGSLGRAQAAAPAGPGDPSPAVPSAAEPGPSGSHPQAGGQGELLASSGPAIQATRQDTTGPGAARADAGDLGGSSQARSETASQLAASGRTANQTPQVGIAAGRTGSLQRHQAGLGLAPEVAVAPAAGMNGGLASEEAGPSGSATVALDSGLTPSGATMRRDVSGSLASANRVGPGGSEDVEAGPSAAASGSGPTRAAAAMGGPRLGIGSGASLARHSDLPGLPADPGAIDLAEAAGPQPSSAPSTNSLADGQAGGAGPTFDRPSQRLANRVAEIAPTDPGIGGLQRDRTPEAGLPHRMAQLESQTLRPSIGRFVLERSSAPQAVEAPLRVEPAPAFRNRDVHDRENIARRHGGTAESERAVEMGLAFLARHQSPDGRWTLHAFGKGHGYTTDVGEGQMEADTAATGLSLLAFLGAGYTHQADKYREQVAAGLQFLVEHQRPDGDLFSALGGNKYAWLYSHGIASIALCEAYGMTRDPALKEPAQRALDFIVAAQNQAQGGWRYAPGVGTDTSVSGWQLMALKSGQMAGLNVDPKVFEGVQRWLNGAKWSGDGALYVYRPRALQEHQRTPSPAMTAEAMLMQMYLGGANEASLTRGAAYLRARLPSIGARPQDRDAYYWYYATQVMFHMQGEPWKAWDAQLRPLLTGTQVQDGPLAGSWNPVGRVPDRWGPQAGRIYVTSLHLLMLEVYYRHLPLFGERVLEVASP